MFSPPFFGQPAYTFQLSIPPPSPCSPLPESLSNRLQRLSHWCKIEFPCNQTGTAAAALRRRGEGNHSIKPDGECKGTSRQKTTGAQTTKRKTKSVCSRETKQLQPNNMYLHNIARKHKYWIMNCVWDVNSRLLLDLEEQNNDAQPPLNMVMRGLWLVNWTHRGEVRGSWGCRCPQGPGSIYPAETGLEAGWIPSR